MLGHKTEKPKAVILGMYVVLTWPQNCLYLYRLLPLLTFILKESFAIDKETHNG